jgi:prolyl-tRNA synthetase
MCADVRLVKEGDRCACCGEQFYQKKGNELGHIFKLGQKYTKSMKVSFLAENGKPDTPTMGCYGIGVDRTLASIIEANNDEHGIIWPMSVAPFQVCIVPIRYDGQMKDVADKLYNELLDAGIEVLLDDRNERPGVKFADMELIGIPLRITVGEKNLPNVEFKPRNSNSLDLIPVDEASEKAINFVKSALNELNS